MTITLDLKPDIEAELARQAAANGVRVETYVTGLLEEAASHRPSSPVDDNVRPEARDMVELFAPLRGMNLDFERDRDTGRDINL